MKKSAHDVIHLKAACGNNIIYDADDMWLVVPYSWSLDGGAYARARGNGHPLENSSGHLYMHHLLGGRSHDHKNRNTLDNRRENLRPFSTRTQNKGNSSKYKNNTSGFKGVHRRKADGLYQAYISFNKKRFNLGTFYYSEDAALEYDRAAIRLFGEFAATNFTHRQKTNADVLSAA